MTPANAQSDANRHEDNFDHSHHPDARFALYVLKDGVSTIDETPSWFPDGKRLAFQSDRTGQMEVWIMNVDGTNPRQLTR